MTVPSMPLGPNSERGAQEALAFQPGGEPVFAFGEPTPEEAIEREEEARRGEAARERARAFLALSESERSRVSEMRGRRNSGLPLTSEEQALVGLFFPRMFT